MRISSRRLGEFLVTRRVLSRDVLDELLAREAAEGVHLSNLLVQGAIVSEQDLMAAVASELGVPYVSLKDRGDRTYNAYGLIWMSVCQVDSVECSGVSDRSGGAS